MCINVFSAFFYGLVFSLLSFLNKNGVHSTEKQDTAF